jgi:hypothetical protein
MVVCMMIVLGMAVAYGAVPETVNYQGYLTDGSGKAINESVTMTFRLYTVPTGGMALWTETHTVVPVDGVYSVVLGSTNALFLDYTVNSQYYLGVQVGADAEMTPRQELSSVGSAHTADTALDIACTNCIAAAEVNTGEIQQRVTGICEAGSSIRVINQDGSVTCEADDTGSITPSNAVAALDGVSAAGTAGEYSRGDHRHGIGAGAITATHILNSTIMNEDISPSAAIAGSKLASDGTVMKTLLPGSNVSVTNNNDGSWTVNSTGAGNDWSLTGNAGTTPGTNFLGTIDNQPLVFRVNNAVALRIEPKTGSPNIIGGSEFNGVMSEFNGVMTDVFGATIGGGGYIAAPNIVTATIGTIGGGATNIVSGVAATVTGGWANTASGYATTVSGNYNKASGDYAIVGGGNFNTASGGAATVSGGYNNTASGDYAIVGGGGSNTASGALATVGGGDYNTASGDYATVSGGFSNSASEWGATVGGGYSNTASGGAATVSGGYSNTASGGAATVGGGYSNTAEASYATVGGGYSNVVTGMCGTIAGGCLSEFDNGGGTENRVTDDYGTIGGGGNNQAGDNAGLADDAYYATVGGGRSNTASGSFSTVGGGTGNMASGQISVIGGGSGNSAGEEFATVSGGASNTASNMYSTVPGGVSAVAKNYGQMAYASGSFFEIPPSKGKAQASLYVLRNSTTGTTQKELFLDGTSQTQRITISANQTVTFLILISAQSDSAPSDSAGYKIEGVIKNYAGNTALIGTPVITELGESISSWSVVAQADDVNDALAIKVTGSTGKNVRWVATVHTSETAW